MPKYEVLWSVTSVANGSGDDVNDGAREIVASGKVEKEAASEADIRSQLLPLLEKSFPKTMHQGTYDLDHVYEVNVHEIAV